MQADGQKRRRGWPAEAPAALPVLLGLSLALAAAVAVRWVERRVHESGVLESGTAGSGVAGLDLDGGAASPARPAGGSAGSGPGSGSGSGSGISVSFGGELLDGWRWSSGSARGRVLVVNVWASWCVPCRAEQPELSAVARAWRDQPVQFIGVNIRDTRAAAQAWVAKFQVPYPSLYDQPARIAAKLQVAALPATIVVGPDGVMAYRLTGPVTAKLLDGLVARLLGQAGRVQA